MNWWYNLLAQYGFRSTIAKNPVPMAPVEVKLVVVQQPNSVQRTLQEEREKVAERVKNREEEDEQREREKKKIFAPFKKILEELSENKTIRVDDKPPEFTIFDTKATVKFGRHELTLDTLVSWASR